MKINNIKVNKSGKYILFIEDKKYTLHQDTIIKYNLYNKKEIDNIDDVLKTNDYYDAYYKIIKFINTKLRTEGEIKKKLKLLNTDNNDIKKIIVTLKNQGYLNNEQYVKAFINDKINLSYDGPFKITKELNKLGFSNEIIDKYLVDSNSIWLERINKIINRKIKSNHNNSQKMLLNKISLDLINLGYSKEMFSDLLNSIKVNEKDILKKEYNKLLNKYLKKYDQDKAIILTKQKLYQKGFDISNI